LQGIAGFLEEVDVKELQWMELAEQVEEAEIEV
jgi:hypothetical protein